MSQPQTRRAAEQPDFSPDLLTALDYINRLVRELFFRRIASHGGWRYRLVACLLLAYLYPY